MLGPNPAAAVIADAAQRFGFSVAQLTGDERRAAVVRARDAAAWTISICLGRSLAQIGRMLGDRDHSTIHAALRRADMRRDSDAEFRETTDSLRAAHTPGRQSALDPVIAGPEIKPSRGDGHGPTPAERAVLELWDGGHSIQAAAARLDRSEDYVREIVSTYHIRPTHDLAMFERMARAGSAALLAALHASGGRFA
ncbi:MAG TPA: helix-turn-helix domain-containing protein [Sphingomonas sp.]|nr:helix-turn-helix domain-containing protein [Sphingomonas sp.]